MNHPKVSICIPTYKQVNYLQRVLDSIVKQDYNDFELIITDDSTDNEVKKLIDKYDFKGKLNYYKNSFSLGSPQNWNECISKASGDYIKIMHHDDWFTYPYSLEKFVLKAEESNGKFIFSEAISKNEIKSEENLHSPGLTFLSNLTLNPEYLFLGNLIGPPSSVLFCRKDWIQFNKELKWLVDIDFFISILKKTSGYCFIKEPLITSVNNGNHNVSNDCLIPEIEVYEYFYVFSKLSDKSRADKKYKDVLIDVLIRYKITSLNEFKKYSRNIVINSTINEVIRKAKIKMKFNKIKSYFNVN